MKVKGRARRSNHPSSCSSSDGDDAPSISNAVRGPRRRRPGAKQEPSCENTAGASKRPIEKQRQESKPTARKRRKRETKEELAALYAQLYCRIPKDPTPQQMAQDFADKELRVILAQNGVLINDYDASGGRGKYTEKTKVQKIEAILSMAKKGCLVPPTRLGDVQPRQKLSRTAEKRSHEVAVRSHTAHLQHDRINRKSSSWDEEDELAPTTPATDVKTEDVTETETDVLELLSTLASSGSFESVGSPNLRPASASSTAQAPQVVWDRSSGFVGL